LYESIQNKLSIALEDHAGLTKSYISDVVSNTCAGPFQLLWRLLVAEEHLWCLLILPSALLELLYHRHNSRDDTGTL